MQKQETQTTIGSLVLAATILNAVVLRAGLVHNKNWYWALLITLPALVVALKHFKKKQ